VLHARNAAQLTVGSGCSFGGGGGRWEAAAAAAAGRGNSKQESLRRRVSSSFLNGFAFFFLRFSLWCV